MTYAGTLVLSWQALASIPAQPASPVTCCQVSARLPTEGEPETNCARARACRLPGLSCHWSRKTDRLICSIVSAGPISVRSESDRRKWWAILLARPE